MCARLTLPNWDASFSPGNVRFYGQRRTLAQLPPPGPPEIAFAGRSNVGKSSLLNALTNRKTLARTSHTPGCTRELNFFVLGGDGESATLRLIDMPGYGHAAASKEKTASWTQLIGDFLRGGCRCCACFFSSMAVMAQNRSTLRCSIFSIPPRCPIRSS